MKKKNQKRIDDFISLNDQNSSINKLDFINRIKTLLEDLNPSLTKLGLDLIKLKNIFDMFS